ncbi:mechanosensitive ion channel [Acidovorax sp. HDW3]|uniref:mechanosensitive ion channel family protein n=1 Tax=Acidovorax sp. HDW3 TaxID=2714923 RepID=UPI001408FBE7|nr:mechanosensitive ion channel domain-containing protein [Acidovorax sp. HDW3]QIL44351.1 mechanosensitive ion channel [Acidovorax sp. HDW3]
MSGPAKTPVFEDLGRWLYDFSRPSILIEIGALLVCAGLAWLVVLLLRKKFYHNDPRSTLFGRRAIDGVLFPLALLGSAFLARALLLQWLPATAFRLAIPVLIALVVVRVGAKVLQLAFPRAHWVPPLEQTISWLAWVAMALWVTGLLPVLLNDLDDIRWKVGASTLSLRTLLEGLVTTGVVLLVTLWLSAVLENRLLRQASGASLSLRKALANGLRALLLFVGLLVAASSVGIDLSTLSVLGGAVGVGVGLGLQKLAASYVSGFVILAERSVRIGDNVRIDGFEGRVTDITGRYTVIRAGSGRESIVPNDMVVGSRVENFSLADPKVWNSTVISVGYDSDVDLVMRLLTEAALSCPRVLREPAPSAALSNFGADGLEFTVGFWIDDPHNGLLGLRSDINLAVLRALRAHAIDIPYPQRVLHWPAGQAPAAAVQ